MARLPAVKTGWDPERCTSTVIACGPWLFTAGLVDDTAFHAYVRPCSIMPSGTSAFATRSAPTGTVRLQRTFGSFSASVVISKRAWPTVPGTFRHTSVGDSETDTGNDPSSWTSSGTGADRPVPLVPSSAGSPVASCICTV